MVKAASMSLRDVKESIQQLGKRPDPTDVLNLVKMITTSGIWISRSSLKYLLSLVDFSIARTDYQPDERTHLVLDSIAKNKPLPKGITHDEAFKIIFNDLEYAHHNHLYQSRLPLPRVNVTMALVSGVFNEIFSTPAFARGAEHLKKETSLKTISLRVSGTKGIDHNVESLYEQLKRYCDKHPNEKIWILAFSKGGVDTLHFMKKYKSFCDKHICGLSTLATPILGTKHIETKIIRSLNFVNQLSEKVAFLDREFQKSLSYEFQSSWFEENHQSLPKKAFYSAVAFESSWYNSHLWMVLTKMVFQSANPNDGVVDTQSAKFPEYFKGCNFGVIKGHHLVGTRSSYFSQEALLEAHLIYLHYLGKI